MKNKHYQWVDTSKTIGLFLVILGHGRLMSDDCHQLIYSFHMPLFFFLSGFLYRYRSLKETLKHDFYRLLIPYFLINGICLILCCPILAIRDGLSVEAIVTRLIGIIVVACNTGEFHPVSSPTWFIIALLIARLLLSLRYSPLYLGIITLFSCLAFWGLHQLEIDLWIPIDSAIMAMPFITSGIIVKKFNRYKIGKVHIFITLVLLSFILMYLNIYNGRVDMNSSCFGNNIFIFYINGLIGSFIIIAISIIFPIRKLDYFCTKISKGGLLVIGFNLMFVMIFQNIYEMLINGNTIPAYMGILCSIIIIIIFYNLTRFCENHFPIILGIKNTNNLNKN